MFYVTSASNGIVLKNEHFELILPIFTERWIFVDEVIPFFRNPHQLKMGEWNVVIDHLEPDSNYSFHAVALTYSGPSEEKVISIRTDRSGKLMSWQLALISIGAVLGFFFIVFGIYSCCR